MKYFISISLITFSLIPDLLLGNYALRSGFVIMVLGYFYFVGMKTFALTFALIFGLIIDVIYGRDAFVYVFVFPILLTIAGFLGNSKNPVRDIIDAILPGVIICSLYSISGMVLLAIFGTRVSLFDFLSNLVTSVVWGAIAFPLLVIGIDILSEAIGLTKFCAIDNSKNISPLKISLEQQRNKR